MTLRRFAILEALNIASTIYGRKLYGQPLAYEASAQEIADTLIQDERFEEYVWLWNGLGPSAREVGHALGVLARNYPFRKLGPLVERAGSRKWKLTSDGCAVLNAG